MFVFFKVILCSTGNAQLLKISDVIISYLGFGVGLWVPPLRIEPYVSLMNVACNANAIQI